MPTNYERGRRIEYRVVEELEAQGYHAQRAASSKGNWDVVAVRQDRVYLVSCKRAKTFAAARRTYAAEKKKLLALSDILPKENVTQGLFIWADALPDKPRGGWYCQDVIE